MYGRSRQPAEPVNAHGNMTSGKAMPEKIPYTDKACEVVKPLLVSICGNCMVSKVVSRLMQMRFKLNGAATEMSSFPFCKEIIRVEDREFCLLVLVSNMMHEKAAEAHSPISIPRQQVAKGSESFLVKEKVYKIYTLPTRKICSISIDNAGMEAFF